MIDPKLVKTARKGDPRAFKELYDQTSVSIFNMMLRMTGNRETAEDLTQDVYLRAWKSLKLLKSPEAFVTWLNTLAMNIYRDWAKSAAHRMEEMRVLVKSQNGQSEDADTDELQNLDLIPSDYPNPDKYALDDEMKRVIEQSISLLPEKHRAVIVMHHIQGMGLKEIADVLGVAQGTVMSRLARARAALRDKLAFYLEGDRS